MAHKTSLAHWLYTKRFELNARFKELTWPQEFKIDLFDFSTTISLNGVMVEGRGTDQSRDIALEKSVAESIERLICNLLGIETTGVAVAGTYDPINHAKFEALERYFLKQHLGAATPFIKVILQKEKIDQFQNVGTGSLISFFQMATPPKYSGLVCMITDKSNLVQTYGFALSESLEDSIRRSLYEALPNFYWLAEITSTVDLDKKILPWYLSKEFSAQIKPLLANATEQKIINFFSLPKFNEASVDYSAIDIIKDAPIFIRRFLITK